MDLKEILQLDPEQMLGKLCVERKTPEKIKGYVDAYEGEHEILRKQDKSVGKGGTARTVKLNKLVVPHQKKIVRIASVFLVGEPVQYTLTNDESDKYEKAYESITEVFDDNKMAYFDRKLVRTVMSETQAAELWYARKPKGKKKEFKVVMLSYGNGDSLFPLFDEFGDMVAFTRKYRALDVEGKKQERADVFTGTYNYYISKTESQGYEVIKEKNLFGKIPVIYYEKALPEWSEVQGLIERDEDQLSKLADVVDYYADPVLKIKGELVDPIAEDGTTDGKGKRYDWKEDVGKTLNFAGTPNQAGGVEYGDAEYLEPNAYPDLRDLERKTIKEYIYSQTSTPDISFNNVKGIGNLSGVTIKMLFLDAIFKAKENEEIYGEGFQRRFNLVKTMLSRTNVKAGGAFAEMKCDVDFGSPIPSDIHEFIESLSIASGGEAIMTKKTAVRQNPLVDDPEKEIQELEDEEVKDLGESYNIKEEKPDERIKPES